MERKSEFLFLKEVLKKSHVNLEVYEKESFLSALNCNEVKDIFNNFEFERQTVSGLLPKSLYKVTDAFERCYYYALSTNSESFIKIGPFLAEVPPRDKIAKIGAENGVSLEKQKYLYEYYDGLKVISPASTLSLAITTFFEMLWNSSDYRVEIIDQKNSVVTARANKLSSNEELTDSLINIKALEQRYAFENEMMRAVSLGRPSVVNAYSSAFSVNAFEKRTSDPLRNAKNYGVIMNTLLRKAAENGGVHPFYLDQISSSFAKDIESCSSTTESVLLMPKILNAYCNLVREHSIKNYPLIVKNTILIIDSDLSSDLSPKILASAQNVSLGYLSSAFKKATGESLCEYIRKRRIEHAVYLLKTTNLQIQTIASKCGIVDVQYFSKLFKRQTGVSPTEYKKRI
ncbi:MAG: helix-turn-helix domain-containing protein [Clostridia bacterium]|nr:helix-turn-helix domain-containing protein [Clostridia bacterium]